MPRKERHLLVDGWKKTDIEYPFKDGEAINYTLDGVSIHPVATQIEASFLTPLMERKETAQGFHREDNGDFKPVRVKIQSKMAGIGETWGWINNIAVTPQY